MKSNAYIGQEWAEVPALLQETRAEAELTLQEVESRAGIKDHWVYAFENDFQDVGFNAARKLFAACGYRLTFVLEPMPGRDGGR